LNSNSGKEEKKTKRAEEQTKQEQTLSFIGRLSAPSLSPEASCSASAHRGSPTPAEFAPFRGVVDGILAPTKTISSLKQVLVGAATKAELNPQPLIQRV